MKKKAMIIGILVSALAIAVLIIGMNTVRSDAKKADRSTEKIYESIEVNADDSLWTISSRYAENYGCSTKEYVETLRHMNGLTTDRICAGDHLIVVHY